MLRLRVKAPFAAFRTIGAGSFRPTAPFMTPSAAYGLLLNVAAIESRLDDGRSVMTVTRTELPPADIALGALQVPQVQTLFQQLHNYPVGATGKERAAAAHGNKHNIQPIRREFLSNLDAYVCLRGNGWLEERVRSGLVAGASYAPDGAQRYGVPFLGDNSFLLSVLREESDPQPAHWYQVVAGDAALGRQDICRLTVWIDRQDMSRTQSLLFSRRDERQLEIPPTAWVAIRPP